MATYRLIRYADDFVILVRGTREQADAVRDEAARVLRDELEMELSEEKTLITHVDEGFDFLGHRIRRVAFPLVLGEGKRLFENDVPPPGLTLVETRSTPRPKFLSENAESALFN
jgi:hypothetical protein